MSRPAFMAVSLFGLVPIVSRAPLRLTFRFLGWTACAWSSGRLIALSLLLYSGGVIIHHHFEIKALEQRIELEKGSPELKAVASAISRIAATPRERIQLINGFTLQLIDYDVTSDKAQSLRSGLQEALKMGRSRPTGDCRTVSLVAAQLLSELDISYRLEASSVLSHASVLAYDGETWFEIAPMNLEHLRSWRRPVLAVRNAIVALRRFVGFELKPWERARAPDGAQIATRHNDADLQSFHDRCLVGFFGVEQSLSRLRRAMEEQRRALDQG